jgi:hydroxypyruvate isomerase
MTHTRREMLGTVGAAGLFVVANSASAQAPRGSVADDFRITNKRIRQSVMGWCFNPMKAVDLAKHCREIGLEVAC